VAAGAAAGAATIAVGTVAGFALASEMGVVVLSAWGIIASVPVAMLAGGVTLGFMLATRNGSSRSEPLEPTVSHGHEMSNVKPKLQPH